jgi:hypothetical protein
MRRNKVTLIILLLSFALLPTASIVIAKKGQQPPDEKLVSFNGNFTKSDAVLTVEERGGNLAVYGPINLVFSDAFDDFKDNGDELDSLRISIKSGRVNMFYDFNWYYNDTVKARVPSYHLEGSGTSVKEDGSYVITLKDAAIYVVVPSRSGKGKKGALGLEFRGPVWGPTTITFTMTMEDIS